MKRQLLLPLAAAAGGAAGLVLRLLQHRTGFEAATGLPIPGNAPGTALAVLLVVLFAVLLLLARTLPPAEEEGGPYDGSCKRPARSEQLRVGKTGR